MTENGLRKTLLNGKKNDRIIFAVTPELKAAISALAKERCTTVSALLTSLSTEAIMEADSDFVSILNDSLNIH